MEEVVGSIPTRSTKISHLKENADLPDSYFNESKKMGIRQLS